MQYNDDLTDIDETPVAAETENCCVLHGVLTPHSQAPLSPTPPESPALSNAPGGGPKGIVITGADGDEGDDSCATLRGKRKLEVKMAEAYIAGSPLGAHEIDWRIVVADWRVLVADCASWR